MNLREQQKSLFEYISGQSLDVPQFIKSAKNISPKTRLGVYRRGFFIRQVECLEGDFPRVLFFLGEKTFTKAGRQYLKKYPSISTTLSNIGLHFPQFIKEDFKYDSLLLEFLPDLALFEWLLVKSSFDSYYGPSHGISFSEGVTKNRLDKKTKETSVKEDNKNVNSAIKVIPSLCFLESLWPLDQIYKEKKTFPKKDTYLMIWGHPLSGSHYSSLTSVEFSVLKALKKFQNLEKTADHFSDTDIPLEELSQVFEKSLAIWLSRGIVQSMDA